MSNNYLFNTLSADAFIMVNKKIAKTLGVVPAIVISELLYECKYWSNRNECKDGWFFSTIENLERETGIKEKQQANALKVLTEKGLIEKKLMGVPAKRYFRIQTNNIVALLDEEEPKVSFSIDEKTDELLNSFKESFYRIYGKAYQEKRNDVLLLNRLNSFDSKIVKIVFDNLEEYLQYDTSIKQEHDITISFLLIPFRRKYIVNYFNDFYVPLTELPNVSEEEIDEFIDLSLNSPQFNEFIKQHIHWWSIDRTKAFLKREDKQGLGFYIEFLRMFKEKGSIYDGNAGKNENRSKGF